MQRIKAILLLTVITLGLAGAASAAKKSCCASADCCASCDGCKK